MPSDGVSSQHRPTIGQTPSYRALKERFQTYFTNNEDGIVDHPIRYIADHKLPKFLKPLHERLDGLATLEELVESAKLAKQGHLIVIGQDVDGMTPAEKICVDNHRSLAFWREPKDLLMTLLVCCLASMVQGWDGVANGNLGWPDEFKIYPTPNNKFDTAKFAVVQAAPWLSASFLGSFLSDPLSEYTGRRVALFIAATCSFTSSIAGACADSFQRLVGTRILLGLGIGGKASIVPVLLSEVLPSSNRGRLLVSWQTFDAAGVFLGSIACYICKNHWRYQIASGTIPALILLLATFASCESPRWLIIRGDYPKAFTTLLRLRKERRLALGEFISVQYQIQAERALLIDRPTDDESGIGINETITDLGRSSWWERLRNMVYLPRVRRAAIAAMVVMVCQQLSGINIYAFLATQFYSSAGSGRAEDRASVICLAAVGRSNNSTLNIPGLCLLPNITDYGTVLCNDTQVSGFNISQACDLKLRNENVGYRFAIGFGAVNTLFSCLAYFLIENKESNDRKNSFASAVKSFFSGILYFFIPDRKRKKRPTAMSEIQHGITDSNEQELKNGSGLNAPFPSTQHVEEPVSEHDGQTDQSNGLDAASTPQSRDQEDKFPEYKWAPRYRGRRFLLLMSFAAGIFTLLATCMIFKYLTPDSDARLPLIIIFNLIFTAFYSPGAGAIPFLYSAEIFPNEGREIGMSWATFWNFLGAGIVAFVAPLCTNWGDDGHAKLLGIFSGLNLVAFLLVWFFVYTTNHATTLEDYSYVFGKKMTEHVRLQATRLFHWRSDLNQIFSWNLATNDDNDEDAEGEESDDSNNGSRDSQRKASQQSSQEAGLDTGMEDSPNSPISERLSKQSGQFPPLRPSQTVPILPPIRRVSTPTMSPAHDGDTPHTDADDDIGPAP